MKLMSRGGGVLLVVPLSDCVWPKTRTLVMEHYKNKLENWSESIQNILSLGVGSSSWRWYTH